MVIRRAKYLVCFVLTATFSGLLLSAASKEEARARPLKLPGLVLISPYQGQSEVNPMKGAEIAVPHPSFASPQRIEQKDQTPNFSSTAPGSDYTKYVPGTSLGSFNQTGAISLGGLVFIKPSAVVSYTYESNLQALSAGQQSDRSLVVTPNIEIFLPFMQDRVRIEYAANYRNYQKFSIAQNFDHTVNADSVLNFTPILSLAVRDHFAMSAINANEYMPGREVIFSDSRFKRNNLGLQLNWNISENDSMEFGTDWNHVFFNESANPKSNPFYNYDQYGFSGTYKRELSERFGIFSAGSFRQSTTSDPRDISNSKGLEFSGGIDGAITPLITGQFSVGISLDRYPGAVQESARSVVFRGGFAKEITERSQVTLSLSRASNLSYFQRNAYFVTTGIGATYNRELRPDMAFSIAGSYQRNGYPLAVEAGSGIPGELVGTQSRLDSFVDATLAVRYRYNDWLAMDVHFDATRRTSNIPGFRFNSYRGGINLLIGSKGSPMGRSPY